MIKKLYIIKECKINTVFNYVKMKNIYKMKMFLNLRTFSINTVLN